MKNKETNLRQKIEVAQNSIENYKRIIGIVEKEVEKLEKEYSVRLKNYEYDPVKNDILGHNYYLLDKYKKLLAKEVKKFDKLVLSLEKQVIKNSKKK